MNKRTVIWFSAIFLLLVAADLTGLSLPGRVGGLWNQLGVCFAGNSPTLDVSANVQMTTANSTSTLDRMTRKFTKTSDVTIKNVSTTTIASPVWAVINITTAGVVEVPTAVGTWQGPSGGWTPGKYYYDLSGPVGQDGLIPGESVTFKVTFVHASTVQFTYSVSLYGTSAVMPNRPPVANAGPDRTYSLRSGQTAAMVVLDGSGSSDPDGTISRYQWVGTTGSGNTQKLNLLLTPGSYTYTLVVTDNQNAQSIPDSIQIMVQPPPNVSPIANAGPDKTFNLGPGQNTINVQLDGRGSYDSDGTLTAFSWTGTPDPADAELANVILGPGTHSFSLMVTDNDGIQSNADSVVITVTPPPNSAPIADAGPDQEQTLTYAQKQMEIALNGRASRDADGEIVSYRWEGPSGGPDPADVAEPRVVLSQGTHQFSLVVKDNTGAESAVDTVKIIINEGAGSPPVITVNPSAATVLEGEVVTVAVSATDPDQESVTLSASPKPANSLFSTTSGLNPTGTLTFSPGNSQQGVYLIAFTARDKRGLVSTKTVPITVTDVNRKPEVSVTSVVEVVEGGLISIPIKATDPDGDILTLSAGPLPANAVFIPATGTITFTPDFTQAGSYDITCTATDGSLSSDPKTVRIQVTDVPGGTGNQELVLVVDNPESPTFLKTARITGRVNSEGPTPIQRITSSLITGMMPSVAAQGNTLEVTLTGSSDAPFATHFAADVSRADFGPGITVNSVTVNSPTLAVARISISPNAEEGSRSVTVATGGETAFSVLAFHVDRGRSSLSGILLDPETRLPIAGAVISLQGTHITTTSGADGRFFIGDAPTGSHVLILTATDHELISMPVNVDVGATVQLGTLESKSTVFNPMAPPSVSLLSVMGRGIGDPTSVKNPEDLKKLIADALLLVGGGDAGVLDEFGNQMNSDVAGIGMISMNRAGVLKLAEKLIAGETLSLQEILVAVSFGFQWSGGIPINLDEWMQTLQNRVNQAWLNPSDIENTLPVLLFNKGKTVTPDPPVLSPHTRLNSFQCYLFLSSLFTTAYQLDNEAGVRHRRSNMLAFRSDRTASDAYTPLLFADSSSSPSLLGKKPFTRFWRNFFQTKNNVIQMGLTAEYVNVTMAVMRNSMMVNTGGLLGAVGAIYNSGTIFDRLHDLEINAGYSNLVPQPPTIQGTEVVKQVTGDMLVTVRFKRSTSDYEPGMHVYTLYRFKGGEEIPQVVDRARFAPSDGLLEFVDPSPFQGTSFYVITVTRTWRDSLPTTVSWWPAAFSGAENIFYLGRHRLTSDYSSPASVYVGPIDFAVTLDGIEVDPDPMKDVVYYSDAGKGALYAITRSGEGISRLFASTGFKTSFRDGREISQVGLAMDRRGNLYCDNAASDDAFGGRLFKFSQPDGSRAFTGSINYFSQLLMFAHPTMSGPMVIQHHSDPLLEDLFVVDNLSGQIKRVPVNQPWDPYRRVGQLYATIPEGGVGRVIDMQFDGAGDLFVLDGWRVIKFHAGTPEVIALFSSE